MFSKGGVFCLLLVYLVPFLLNQSGSFVFYFTLASTVEKFLFLHKFLVTGNDLSLAAPMVNSLTFLFMLLMGKLLGEEIEGKRAVLGMLLIMSGVTVCVLSSVSETDSAEAHNTSDH
uniref:Transmembrane protein 234 n=2 Tax=Cyprinus carpio TaxID=7962 RepID=A0A8C1SJG3_CYPCA